MTLTNDQPRMEQFLDARGNLGSNGLVVFLTHEHDALVICLSDADGQAVLVDLSDVDEVIAALAACRYRAERRRPELDREWKEFKAAAAEGRKRLGIGGGE